MTNSDEQIQLFSIELFSGITEIIEKSKTKAAVFLNSETTVLYWSIGKFINENLKTQKRTSYSNKIVATVSQQLTNMAIIAAILQQPMVYFLSEDQALEDAPAAYQTKQTSGDLTQQVYMLIKEVQQLQSDVKRIDLELAEVRRV